MRLLVPGGIALGRAQAEGAAQVDDLGAGAQHGRREFHGDVGRSGEKDDSDPFGAHGVGSARERYARAGAPRMREVSAGVLPMFQQDRGNLGMAVQNPDEFRSAVAAMADDTGEVH